LKKTCKKKIIIYINNMALKPPPFVAVEQPELGLAGPILYRAYQIEQGIEAIEEKRRRDEEEERIREENFRIASERFRNYRPPGGYSSMGSYIIRPPHRGSARNTSDEEKIPLL
jgi:hypothetical protein